MLIRVSVLLVVVCLPSARASAQIFAWHDASGTLVLADHKGSPDATTFVAPSAPVMSSTASVAPNDVRGPFEPLIQTHAARYALTPDLVRTVIQAESGFNPRALSPKGAMGLMQLMPQTARAMGVLNPFDPEDSIRGGAGYLRQLLDRYSGSLPLALAAYNAGPNAVDRYGGQVPPFRETQDYVKKISFATAKIPTAASRPPVRQQTIYKIVEVIDGRPVARYSTERPSPGTFETVAP